jgi:hypothetical protein
LRPIIICGHDRAWPSTLNDGNMKMSYRDYPTVLGNDLKRILGSSRQSFCPCDLITGLTAESIKYIYILLDPAIKSQDDRKASPLVVFAM